MIVDINTMEKFTAATNNLNTFGSDRNLLIVLTTDTSYEQWVDEICPYGNILAMFVHSRDMYLLGKL